jgi:hypothetical protein
VASHLVGESIRVHLPAWIRARACPDGAGHDTATHLTAICTRLSATHVRLEADQAPAHGEGLELKIALPGHREMLFCGAIRWSITTSAPALLCGAHDRSLGARFDFEIGPASRDLLVLVGLLSRRSNERRARVRSLARRAGIALPPRRNRQPTV